MDGCPISFGPNLQSRPNPTFVSATWQTAAGAIIVAITWSTDMDQTFLPANASWELKIDSTVRAIDVPAWQSDTVITLTSAVGSAPLVDVTLELLVQDPALHSDHLIPVLPFGPETIPEV